MSPIVLIGGSLFLLGIGAVLGYLLAFRFIARDAKAVSDVQEELDEYRRSVTEHFGETAQHFQALGEQYQSLYRHLAKGAGSLCDPAQSNALLDFSGKTATPIAANTEVEAEAVPEAPIDYVAEQATADAEPEPEIEVPEAAEPQKEQELADDAHEELPAEDAGAEPVPSTDKVEEERTVH